MKNKTVIDSRRQFLKIVSTSSAAFALGVQLPLKASINKVTNKVTKDTTFVPNAFIEIFQDETIVIQIKYLEMGQGAYTGLCTLIAEELEADWQQLKPKHAPADASKYSQFGPFQMTGGSGGIKVAYMQMRQAGAAAKEMLLSAAAQLWQVNKSHLQCHKGQVINSLSGLTVSYGQLATLAATQAVPVVDTLKLKQAKDFTYIGKKLPRLDIGKNNGTAIYTQDIQLDNMLTAVVAHSPKFSGELKSYQEDRSKRSEGVFGIFKIPSGVAVVAENFWLAKQAREQLKIQWDNSQAEVLSSHTLMESYKKLANTSGRIAHQTGNAELMLAQSDNVIELNFEFPFLAHATMEPMNCVAQVTEHGCELWCSAQIPTKVQNTIGALLKIDPQQVKINTVFAGGSFGRRASPHAEYIVETVNIAKQLKGTPVKLVWTREDDMQAGYFRPMYHHKVKASVDKQGNISAWHHRVVGKSLSKGSGFFEEHFIQNGIDSASVEGLTNMPYKIEHTQIELHSPSDKIPGCAWRSVGNTHTAYAKEVMIDKLALSIGLDPYQFRLNKVDNNSREAQVLKLAAEKSNWDKKLPVNWGRGIALHKSFDTHVAQVAEVSVNSAGKFKVERIICVVDCGLAVNPDVIEAQMQGGIGFGLGPFIHSEITIKNGQVVETNYDRYKVARMTDMPKIEVYIVPSAEPPTGVGEPSTCVIAPAIANALANVGIDHHEKLPVIFA